MVIGFICEGATDIPVLEEILHAILPNGWTPRYLKPERDHLERFQDGGWTRVREWCQQWGPHIAWLPERLHVLVVQVDADIRAQLPGHPKTTKQVCNEVKKWLGSGAGFPGLVIVIPSEAIETWILAAHRPANPQLEGLMRPAERLVSEKLISASPKGDPIKDVANYRALAQAVRTKLPALRATLSELDRFCIKVEALLPDLTSKAP